MKFKIGDIVQCSGNLWTVVSTPKGEPEDYRIWLKIYKNQTGSYSFEPNKAYWSTHSSCTLYKKKGLLNHINLLGYKL